MKINQVIKRVIFVFSLASLFVACDIDNESTGYHYEYPEVDVSMIEDNTIFLNKTLLLEYVHACEEFDRHIVYKKGKAYYEGPKYHDNQLFMYLVQKLVDFNNRREKEEISGRAFPRTKMGSENHSNGFTPITKGATDQQTGERVLSALAYYNNHHNDGLRFRDLIDISSFTHMLTSGYCTLENGLWMWAVIRKDAAISNNNDELNSFQTMNYGSGGGIIRVDYNYNSEPAITLHTENTAAFNAIISNNF